MHVCALTAAAALVLAALAALLIEHGPRLFARRPQSGPLALSREIADTSPTADPFQPSLSGHSWTLRRPRQG